MNENHQGLIFFRGPPFDSLKNNSESLDTQESHVPKPISLDKLLAFGGGGEGKWHAQHLTVLHGQHRWDMGAKGSGGRDFLFSWAEPL